MVVIRKEDVDQFLQQNDTTNPENARAIKQALEFLYFAHTGKVAKKGTPLNTLLGWYGKISEVKITRATIDHYIQALEQEGYSKESIRKRLIYARKLIEPHSKQLSNYLKEHSNKIRRLKRARNTSPDAPAIIPTPEHVRTFFSRIEKLHRNGNLNEEPYLKSILLARILIDTGEWKHKVATLKLSDINLKDGTIKIDSKTYRVSQETLQLMRYYVSTYKNLIKYYQNGYLFILPTKTRTSTLYINKIMRKYQNILKFPLSEDARFEFDHLRIFGKYYWTKTPPETWEKGTFLPEWTKNKITNALGAQPQQGALT